MACGLKSERTITDPLAPTVATATNVTAVREYILPTLCKYAGGGCAAMAAWREHYAIAEREPVCHQFVYIIASSTTC